MAFARGQDRWLRHRSHVCPMPVPPPACAVIARSEAGIGGTIASVQAAEACSKHSPQTKPAIGSRPAGAWRRTTRPPRGERKCSLTWRTRTRQKDMPRTSSTPHHVKTPACPGPSRVSPSPVFSSLSLEPRYRPVALATREVPASTRPCRTPPGRNSSYGTRCQRAHCCHVRRSGSQYIV
jgi:hypothetical protein